MGPAQPPRHRARKKAKLFSARPDPKSKRSAQQAYCRMTVILSANTTPRVGRDQALGFIAAGLSFAPSTEAAVSKKIKAKPALRQSCTCHIEFT